MTQDFSESRFAVFFAREYIFFWFLSGVNKIEFQWNKDFYKRTGHSPTEGNPFHSVSRKELPISLRKLQMLSLGT